MQILTGEAGATDNLFAGRLIYQALRTPIAAIAYGVSEELAARFGDQSIIESDDWDFNVEGFAEAGLCTLEPHQEYHAQVVANWHPDNESVERELRQAWLRIGWQGQSLQLLRLSWPGSCGQETFRWLLAESPALAESFFRAVCAWNNTVAETILVFEDGYWQKHRDLYQAIQRATLDNLILGGTLKNELHADLAAFFRSKEVYERANVPWKRGVVLIGPPGNGKTHAVKALINALGRPCLYVKSFSTQNADDHHNIRAVFARARETAPCILVMEDLDSLVTDHNRSFFLNELDGFATNEGVVVLATTNHPERLDAAIMARPSRFDRKYHFGLPGAAERQAYLELWTRGLDEAMRPAAATVELVVAGSEGFSFAYVKELVVASTVRWAEHQKPGAMDTLMPAQLEELRAQMVSGAI